MGRSPRTPSVFACNQVEAYSWNVGTRSLLTGGGGFRLRHTPARTRARTLSSSTAAVRSFHAPPQPHSQLRRSCRTSCSRRPSTKNRSLKTRVPSPRVLVSTVPVAGLLTIQRSFLVGRGGVAMVRLLARRLVRDQP